MIMSSSIWNWYTLFLILDRQMYLDLLHIYRFSQTAVSVKIYPLLHLFVWCQPIDIMKLHHNIVVVSFSYFIGHGVLRTNVRKHSIAVMQVIAKYSYLKCLDETQQYLWVQHRPLPGLLVGIPEDLSTTVVGLVFHIMWDISPLWQDGKAVYPAL